MNWFANCILVDWLIDWSIDRTNERAKKKKKINKLLSKLKMIILYCKKWQGIPNLNDFFFFFLKGCHNQWLFLQDILIILIALKFGGKYFCSEHFKKNSNHCRIIQKIYVCVSFWNNKLFLCKIKSITCLVIKLNFYSSFISPSSRPPPPKYRW